MEVLKKPDLKPKTYDLHCKCGAELRASREDIKASGVDRGESYTTFNCPFCNTDIYVSTKILPRGF